MPFEWPISADRYLPLAADETNVPGQSRPPALTGLSTEERQHLGAIQEACALLQARLLAVTGRTAAPLTSPLTQQPNGPTHSIPTASNTHANDSSAQYPAAATLAAGQRTTDTINAVSPPTPHATLSPPAIHTSTTLHAEHFSRAAFSPPSATSPSVSLAEFAPSLRALTSPSPPLLTPALRAEADRVADRIISECDAAAQSLWNAHTGAPGHADAFAPDSPPRQDWLAWASPMQSPTAAASLGPTGEQVRHSGESAGHRAGWEASLDGVGAASFDELLVDMGAGVSAEVRQSRLPAAEMKTEPLSGTEPQLLPRMDKDLGSHIDTAPDADGSASTAPSAGLSTGAQPAAPLPLATAIQVAFSAAVAHAPAPDTLLSPSYKRMHQTGAHDSPAWPLDNQPAAAASKRPPMPRALAPAGLTHARIIDTTIEATNPAESGEECRYSAVGSEDWGSDDLDLTPPDPRRMRGDAFSVVNLFTAQAYSGAGNAAPMPAWMAVLQRTQQAPQGTHSVPPGPSFAVESDKRDAGSQVLQGKAHAPGEGEGEEAGCDLPEAGSAESDLIAAVHGKAFDEVRLLCIPRALAALATVIASVLYRADLS